MNLLYQILCEVRVLHEYYLTDPDNSSVFQDTTQSGRLAWFTRREQTGLPAGSKDLQFVLPPCMTSLFRNKGIQLLPADSGFQLGLRVTQTVVGGTTRYAPAIPLAGIVNLIILMKTGVSFPAITNGRMQRPVPSLYYFSNVSLGSPKTAPALSRPISADVTGYPYEQGELVANGSQIELKYYTGGGLTEEPIPGNGFANENDRLIVPTTFDYTFLSTNPVTSAQFTLKDTSGNVARSYTYTAVTPLTGVTLVFDDAANLGQPALTTLPRAAAADAILYTLEVTGNGGYTQTISLIFYAIPADLASVWGVIQLQVQVADSGFSLVDSTGLLYPPPPPPPPPALPDPPYPVFEIRCKSRYTFWNYQCEDPTQVLDNPVPPSAVSQFLQPTATPGILTTNAPIPSTYLPWFFSENPAATPPDFTYLPNPPPDAVIQIAAGQVISNIWVPASGVFPTSPAPPT
jgi:hypothetical protein